MKWEYFYLEIENGIAVRKNGTDLPSSSQGLNWITYIQLAGNERWEAVSVDYRDAEPRAILFKRERRNDS